MPEHDLEPPRFSRRSLERILNDWTAVKAMIMSGKKGTSSPDVVYEDQLYLDSQSGTARLDKFTHTLLVKCSVEVRSSRVKLHPSPSSSFGDFIYLTFSHKKNK